MRYLTQKIIVLIGSLSIGTYAFLLLLLYFGVFLISSPELLNYTKSLVSELFNDDSLSYIGVGFGAQLVDGALGMAYGACSTSFLLSLGVSPAAAAQAFIWQKFLPLLLPAPRITNWEMYTALFLKPS